MGLFARSVQHSRVRSVVASSMEKLEQWDFITLRRLLENESSKKPRFWLPLFLGVGPRFAVLREKKPYQGCMKRSGLQPINLVFTCIRLKYTYEMPLRFRERIFVARILWTSSPNIRGTFVVDEERFDEYRNASETPSLVSVHLHDYSGILWRADGHERPCDSFISH